MIAPSAKLATAILVWPLSINTAGPTRQERNSPQLARHHPVLVAIWRLERTMLWPLTAGQHQRRRSTTTIMLLLPQSTVTQEECIRDQIRRREVFGIA